MTTRDDEPRDTRRDRRRERRPELGPIGFGERELGGRDPLDPTFPPHARAPRPVPDVGVTPSDVAEAPAIELPAAPTTRLQRVMQRLRTHAAFGLAPALAPAMLFVPLGYLLGPPGLNLLPADVFAHLDPVISVGLAALGVFVGLALGRRPNWETRLFVAASVEAIVTIVIVLGAILFLLDAWHFPTSVPRIAIALALGVAASASSAASVTAGANGTTSVRVTTDTTADPIVDPTGTPHALASRIADLDDVLPIVIGALAIAVVVAPEGAWQAIAQLAIAALLGLAVGVIGWLLIERARSIAERGVFVVGSLALVGGASAYLSLSPLLAGLAAGIFWNWSPGRADVIVREDLRRFQHPLVVLMLLAAGASLQLSLPALWLFAPFVVFRLAGKLAGGWLASRLTPSLAPGDLGAYLLAPGLLGIAFALNAHQHLPGDDGVALLTAVVIGTLASEGVALFVTPNEGQA
jgi:hypothetical protein